VAKKSKAVPIMLGIVIALVILSILFLFGYSSFLSRQVYGPDVGTFYGWRNYVSYVFSKIPFVKNYVQYESLETISPSDYFEKVYQKYQEQLNNQLADIQNREAELAKKEEEINKMLSSLTEIENSWKEQKLKEELNKVQDTVSLTRLNDIVDTFANSDPAQLTRLMNADNMSVDTLAVVFSKLTPDTRAEMLQKLTSANPQKAAQIVEKMGGVDQIISDIDFKVEELKNTINDLVNTEATIISLSGFSKGVSAFLSDMSYDELWNFVLKIQSRPDLVLYILSNVDSQTTVRLLRDIKDNNEQLFIDIMNKGVKP